MKSIREYPKATRISIPMAAAKASLYFRLPDYIFKNPAGFQEMVAMRSDSYPHLSAEITKEGKQTSEGRTATELTILQTASEKSTAVPIATFHGEAESRFVISLLVPVAKLSEKAIVLIDWLRESVKQA